LAPWAALPTKDGSLLIERLVLRFVVMGRDLLRESVDAGTTEALVLADPDYVLAVFDRAAQANPMRRGRAPSSPVGSALVATSRALPTGTHEMTSAFLAPALSEESRALCGEL
jgi:hypothetical protein